MVLRADRRAGRDSASRDGSLAAAARRALRYDAIGDRAPRERGAAAADRHAARNRDRARLRADRRTAAGEMTSDVLDRLDRIERCLEALERAVTPAPAPPVARPAPARARPARQVTAPPRRPARPAPPPRP